MTYHCSASNLASPKDGEEGPSQTAELAHQPQVELHSKLCVVHPVLQLIVAVKLGVHGRLGREEVWADLHVVATVHVLQESQDDLPCCPPR